MGGHHNDLLEDELQFRELLQDFAMAEELPESEDKETFSQEDSNNTLFLRTAEKFLSHLVVSGERTVT